MSRIVMCEDKGQTTFFVNGKKIDDIIEVKYDESPNARGIAILKVYLDICDVNGIRLDGEEVYDSYHKLIDEMQELKRKNQKLANIVDEKEKEVGRLNFMIHMAKSSIDRHIGDFGETLFLKKKNVFHAFKNIKKDLNK